MSGDQLELPDHAESSAQLDINRNWTSYFYYHHIPTFMAVQLTTDQLGPARRYLQTSTRDLVAVDAC